jgi:hypothetical protein
METTTLPYATTCSHCSERMRAGVTLVVGQEVFLSVAQAAALLTALAADGECTLTTPRRACQAVR